jgi:hypothetical protein
MKQTHLSNYYITEEGKVFSDKYNTKSNKSRDLIEIKPTLNKKGYMYINPYHSVQKRTYIRLHRWVWETFMGPIPEGLEINHIDHNKLNNSLSNLELVTHRENMIKYSQFKKEQSK